MIVKDDFLKKLRSAFDLNIYEVKIWTALLSRGLASAGELSDISGVPRSRSYDVLESLEKRGFVIIKLGKPIKYIAVPPEEVLKRVKRHIKTTTDYQIDMLEKVRSTTVFKEIGLLHKQGITNIEPSSLSGAIRGRANIRNQIESMLDAAEKSVVIMTSASGFLRKAEDHKKTFKRLTDKNVKVRIAAPLTEEAKQAAKDLKGMADVRNLQNLTSRFVLVDGKELLFMVDDDKNVHESYDIGIWVNSPYFAQALTQMFETTWARLK